ncbi:hypothetical protein NDU88_007132 [Pleurodeles waltl]|uniref:Uncharacterized protein n=1 Tax=Pleurodeles waltl TaxID=8319 RepID=A0AAV7N643_PLEWA|nr:hypothetical protein NDU88_007132 [Pleurodeles waltl]
MFFSYGDFRSAPPAQPRQRPPSASRRWIWRRRSCCQPRQTGWTAASPGPARARREEAAELELELELELQIRRQVAAAGAPVAAGQLTVFGPSGTSEEKENRAGNQSTDFKRGINAVPEERLKMRWAAVFYTT